MKRVLSILIIILVAMTGCTAQSAPINQSIAPILLSEREQSILQAFNLDPHSSRIYEFTAPEEALVMKVNVYRFEQGKGWETLYEDAIPIRKEQKNKDDLKGRFALQISEDYAMAFSYETSYQKSYAEVPKFQPSDEAALTFTGYGGGYMLLNDQKHIPLNQDVILYHAAIKKVDNSGSSSFASVRDEDVQEIISTDDHDEYFMQIVTLTFSDQEI